MKSNKVNPMKKLVVSNRKGGVGKTFISTHLAHSALEKELKLLFVDNDPQGNAGDSLEAYATNVFKTIDIFTQKIDFASCCTGDQYFILFKGTDDLEELEVENLEILVDNIVEASNYFDLCLIDTPPTSGKLQNYSFLISDFILSPFQLDNFSYTGFATLIERIAEIKEINDSIQFLGFIPNLVDLRSSFDREQLKTVTEEYASYMFGAGAYIPLRTHVKLANHTGIPVWKVKNGAKTGKLVRQLNNAIFDKIGV
ncbi:ParA family protein (plasmid) [Acinetobacter seifertii]|uniref:ParA family protein n=1 Tax=Acinetobacter seifertii TaxID=1530123 RepID=UPI00168C0367|nr:ParA family protein [Acinetobacter seifertii]QNX28760.1 ParA family protein [Acinetobacter seifertii]